MRILGLDLGQKRIGVAVSDPLGITAQGLTVIKYEKQAAALERLAAICREYDVTRIVAGLPLHLSGERGTAVKAVEALAAAVEKRTGLPVELVDERLTSKAAERTLIAGNVRRKARKEVRDMLAAVLILESYLGSAVKPKGRKPAVNKLERSVCPVMEESSVGRDDVVTLTDEAGNEHDFAVIDAFMVDERRYAILLPVYGEAEEEEDFSVDFEDDAYIFRVEMDDETGEETLSEVEDEDEWKRVAEAWEERLDEQEDDDEDEEEDEDFF